MPNRATRAKVRLGGTGHRRHRLAGTHALTHVSTCMRLPVGACTTFKPCVQSTVFGGTTSTYSIQTIQNMC